MNPSKLTLRILLVAVAACLLCCTVALAKKGGGGWVEAGWRCHLLHLSRRTVHDERRRNRHRARRRV